MSTTFLMRSFSIRLFIVTPCLLGTALAQGVNAPVKTVDPYNPLLIAMVSITILLAFVIWGMGQVLITMSRQALDKLSKPPQSLPIILIVMFSGISISSNAQVAVANNYGGIGSTSFWMLITVLLVETATIFFLLFCIRRIQSELLEKPVKKQQAWIQKWNKLDKKIFTKAIAVEKEADIMLDHDYDGIRELDNALPPWWKYGFYITICVACIYIFYFHVARYGLNPTEEYQAELAKAQIAKEIYEANNFDKVDENNIKMPAVAGIQSGQEIFTSICSSCHGKAGEGGAGPNLTDDYWLHKGAIRDIYLSIKKGYPEKGMQSWEKNYSPKDINNLAGYIITLHGSKPVNAKAPQGEFYQTTNQADTMAVRVTTEMNFLSETKSN